MRLHESESICELQSQLFVEHDRLFKAADSRVGLHRESGSVSEMVQDRHVVITVVESVMWPIPICVIYTDLE